MTDITFVGAGALGQGMAALLARSGPVSLLARPATAAALQEAGVLRVRTPGGEITVPVGSGPGAVRVIDAMVEIDPAAAVVMTPKGHNLGVAIEALRQGWQPTTGYVLGLQNGVQKDRLLAEAFGDERVLGAATVLGARREDDGVVRVTSLGQTYLGEFDGSRSQRLAALTARFEDAELPVRADLDIARLLWTKCVNALGAFGVSCLTQLPSNVMMRSEQLAGLFLDLLAEAASVAAAEGHPVDDFPDLPIATYLADDRQARVRAITEAVRATSPTPPSYSSMAMDVIHARPTEVEAVFGDVVERARAHGLEVPRLTLVRDVVAGLDDVRELRSAG